MLTWSPVVVHVRNVRFPRRQVIENDAHGILRGFQEQLFDGLEQLAVFVLLVNDLGRDTSTSCPSRRICSTRMAILHFAAAAHIEYVRRIGLLDAQGDVGAHFLDQALPDVSRGDELPVDAGQRAVVDGELHLDCGGVDRDEGERRALFGVGDGLADEHVFKAGDPDDIAA